MDETVPTMPVEVHYEWAAPGQTPVCYSSYRLEDAVAQVVRDFVGWEMLGPWESTRAGGWQGFPLKVVYSRDDHLRRVVIYRANFDGPSLEAKHRACGFEMMVRGR